MFNVSANNSFCYCHDTSSFKCYGACATCCRDRGVVDYASCSSKAASTYIDYNIFAGFPYCYSIDRASFTCYGSCSAVSFSLPPTPAFPTLPKHGNTPSCCYLQNIHDESTCGTACGTTFSVFSISGFNTFCYCHDTSAFKCHGTCASCCPLIGVIDYSTCFQQSFGVLQDYNTFGGLPYCYSFENSAFTCHGSCFSLSPAPPAPVLPQALPDMTNTSCCSDQNVNSVNDCGHSCLTEFSMFNTSSALGSYCYCHDTQVFKCYGSCQSKLSVGFITGISAAVVCVVVFMMLFLVFRARRRSRSFKTGISLCELIQTSARTTFRCEYGHSVKDHTGFELSFGQLQLARKRVQLGREVDRTGTYVVHQGCLLPNKQAVNISCHESTDVERQSTVLREAMVLHLFRHDNILALLHVCRSVF